jgi:hypothetical protein
MALNNATLCQDDRPLSVNFDGNTPSIGEVWNTLNINLLEKPIPYCVTITTGVTEVTSTKLLTTQYTDCYDCMSNNYGIVLVTDCIGDSKIRSQYNLTLESFGFLPTIGATYYLTFLIEGSSLITTCVTVNREGIRQLTESDYNNSIADGKIGVVQIVPTLETNCQDCLSGNSLSYEVQRCTDSETDYVLLINNSFINHIIAYSDGVNEYCGTVVGLGTGGVPFTFINDYGLGGDGGSATCDQCLATENQKVLLQSCTDSEYTEVVWAASLFGTGDISNLSTDSGCFIVSGLTDADVTINNYLNFDPQPGCEPCIECNGINYSYTTCSGDYSGDFKSYQYLSGGTKFYNPAIGLCCEVIGTSSSYYDTLYSVETFEDCPDCQDNADVVIWNASACTNSNTYSSIYVTTDSTAQIGDVVKLMWGSNEWICAGLINTASSYSGGYTYFNTQKNGSGSTLRYDTCETCNSQGLIGVTLVNCDTLVESFVSITLDNYLSVYNFGSLTNYSVKDSNGSCYQITNLCPIPLEEQGFTAVEFYFNCTFCETTVVNPPRSANTESFVCVICCDCGATGSTVNQVSPPHPVWTDGYGTQVTQLNMITLGGMNGLNS